MSQPASHQIYSIGHSNLSIDEFIEKLKAFKVKTLIDVRRFPGSRKFPHFGKEQLKDYLEEHHINYQHHENLGGRRKAQPKSKNHIWRHPSFRAYADYMETKDFKIALQNLKSIAHKQTTVMMCSEALWWSCHRAMISDALKADGWQVLHIMSAKKATQHPYTKPAKIINGKLTYKS